MDVVALAQNGIVNAVAKLIADGKLDLEPLATYALPFTHYAEGLELLRNREAIKVRFLPWAE